MAGSGNWWICGHTPCNKNTALLGVVELQWLEQRKNLLKAYSSVWFQGSALFVACARWNAKSYLSQKSTESIYYSSQFDAGRQTVHELVLGTGRLLSG